VPQVRKKGSIREIDDTHTNLRDSLTNADSLQDAILLAMPRRLSGLLLLPLKEVETSKPIFGYGVNSLLAGKCLHWIWSALKVDMPLLSLTKGDENLIALAQQIVAQLH
jgi:hypothetical protein